jgi:NAD(P)H-nitrite reductase large subunit
VVGSGFIGSEVASTVTALGAQVTVLERADRPLGHVLGGRMGDVCAALQRTHGIDLRTGQAIRDYRETATAAIITTGDGHRLEADVVVVAAGMVPNTEVLGGSGITLGDGDIQSLDFIAFYLKNGVVRAAFAINRGDDIAAARQLIAGRATPSPAALADKDVPLAI